MSLLNGYYSRNLLKGNTVLRLSHKTTFPNCLTNQVRELGGPGSDNLQSGISVTGITTRNA